MTTDLEKQFFDTFGIKTKYIYYIKDTSIKSCYYSATKKDILNYFTNKNHRKYKVFNVKIEHPQITDRILLELICILNPFCYPSGQNIQHLKESVLDWCITFKDDIEQQVQVLFEEG